MKAKESKGVHALIADMQHMTLSDKRIGGGLGRAPRARTRIQFPTGRVDPRALMLRGALRRCEIVCAVAAEPCARADRRLAQGRQPLVEMRENPVAAPIAPRAGRRLAQGQGQPRVEALENGNYKIHVPVNNRLRREGAFNVEVTYKEVVQQLRALLPGHEMAVYRASLIAEGVMAMSLGMLRDIARRVHDARRAAEAALEA